MKLRLEDIGFLLAYVNNIESPIVKDEEFGYGIYLGRFEHILGNNIFYKIDKNYEEFCSKQYMVYKKDNITNQFSYKEELEEFKTISGRLTKGYRAIENRNFFKEKDTGLILAIYRDPKYEEEVFNMTTGLSYKDFIDKNNYNHILEGDRQENNSTDKEKDCTISWE